MQSVRVGRMRGMVSFPGGNFTITNCDTGRCLRARLGESKDISDCKEGTKYLLSKTDPPALELGADDGSAACAWYLNTGEDPQYRIPYLQIVNVAVRDLQNIGNYCVCLQTERRAKHAPEHDELAAVHRALTGGQKQELAAVIPTAWSGDQKSGSPTAWPTCAKARTPTWMRTSPSSFPGRATAATCLSP
ncbi:hypothetical protein [Streptomyces sp. NPDC050264]|uniref:hypothetical protein n=1 Tax=Streptomyces sp. NPDC050264 TaxID=3155038 RepID=UPI0034129023